jgi:hypothetical protein
MNYQTQVALITFCWIAYKQPENVYLKTKTYAVSFDQEITNHTSWQAKKNQCWEL